MSSTNVASAARTTPFLCNIYGYNRSAASRNDVSSARSWGDLYNLINIEGEMAAVRMLLPHFAEFTQSYFTLNIAPAAGDSWSLRLAVAEFEQEGGVSTRTTITSGYSENYINRWHRRITDRDEPISADENNPVEISNLQIASALRQLTPEQKYQDAFALMFVFDSQPDTDWDVTQLRLVSSGEVTP